MLRQYSGGGNRSRGLKPKDALHISLILAVSIWILYHLTYMYQDNNSLFDGFMPVNLHQEHRIKQESAQEHTGDIGSVTGKTDTTSTVGHEKDQERKIADTVHEDKEREIADRIKEHEAREKSFKDDDVSSSVLHDDQTLDVEEELTSDITTYPQKQNLTNGGDRKSNFSLGNGTIDGTALEKNISLSHLGNSSVMPDEIEDIESK